MPIPLHLLEKRGHIHFYDHIELYTDTLQGRGHSEVSVKVRSMEDCFLILVRSYVCVNDQSVFLRDVRYYHEYGSRYESLSFLCSACLILFWLMIR